MDSTDVNDQLLEDIRALAADIFGTSKHRLGEDSMPENTDNWDSIAHVSLVVAIEEQFAVTFDPDEITSMKSIGSIARMLTEKLYSRDS